MTTWGLTSAGWLSKPLDVIESEVDTGLQKILGASAATEPDGTIPAGSMAGQLKALVVDPFAAFWDLFQALASAQDPTQATDEALDVVCSITGTKREGNLKSSVTATCTGTPNTVLPVGRVAVTTDASNSRFDSAAALSLSDPNYPASTITALSAWASSTAYTIGQRVTNSGNAYQCIQSGTSSGSPPGPTGTTLGATIIDGGAEWVFLGVGTGAVDVLFQSEVAGAIGALANKLTQIATPANGWQGVTNLNSAAVGQLQESNSALRVRRDAELAADGNSVPDAIRGHILALNQNSVDPNHLPVTDCTVFYNDTDFTDANGLPPHSVEVLVYYNQGVDVPTTDQDIANAVWASVGAGIAKIGNQTSTVVDSQGVSHTVHWSKPTPVPIYVAGTVYYDATKWPAVGAPALVVQAAVSALLTFGLTYRTGHSVRSLPLGAAIVDGPSATDANGNAVVPAPATAAAAPGLLDVTPLNIGTAPSPGSSAPIAIGTRQIAQFSSANMNLTAAAETP
jgi:hypothetical protein